MTRRSWRSTAPSSTEPGPAPTQGELNAEVWRPGTRLRFYSRAALRPVERAIIDRYAAEHAGRTLEIACGAGRVTRALAAAAERVEAFDIAPRMVAACRAACPQADVRVGDMRDLSPYPEGAYDAVWIAFNTIDVLGAAEREAFLDAVRLRLTPDGLLIFSSHNRAAPVRGPLDLRPGGPLDALRLLAHLPARLRNHRRTAPLEREEPDYAIRSDEENDFAGLHYYVARDTQEDQLARHGLALVECLDLAGRPVARGDAAEATGELHYVARVARPAH